MQNNIQTKIAETCDSIKQMLLEKNKAYGNSALDPVRIFSNADPVEQIKVRIDDKLSRLKRGRLMGEDVVNDLIGYLVLLKIALGEPISECTEEQIQNGKTDLEMKYEDCLPVQRTKHYQERIFETAIPCVPMAGSDILK